MNFDTGSVSSSLPSSYSIITATLVTGLVIEAMRNSVSVRIGVLAAHVLEARGVHVDDLAVAGDQRDDAAGFLAIDEALHAGVEPAEPLGGDADGGRAYGRAGAAGGAAACWAVTT